jgi:phage gpG-like protein
MISVTITGDQRVIERLRGAAERVRASLLKAMQREWFALQSHIVRDKLSGQVLHRVTGNLASSINAGGPNTATEFLETPTELIARVGTRVVYGRIHEYGGTFRTRRGHTVTFPERSFLRSGLQDRAAQIRDSLASAAQAAMGSI